MAKNKSKPSVHAPIKKGGDGGRITKPSAAVEKAKVTAKAVQSVGANLKSVLKPSSVYAIQLAEN